MNYSELNMNFVSLFFSGQVTIPSKIPQQQRHLGGGQVTIVGGNQGRKTQTN